MSVNVGTRTLSFVVAARNTTSQFTTCALIRRNFCIYFKFQRKNNDRHEEIPTTKRKFVVFNEINFSAENFVFVVVNDDGQDGLVR